MLARPARLDSTVRTQVFLNQRDYASQGEVPCMHYGLDVLSLWESVVVFVI